VTTSYYAFGGAMVAMRDGAGAPLVYLHGDQLGSTALTTNASGQKVSEQPFDTLRASGMQKSDPFLKSTFPNVSELKSTLGAGVCAAGGAPTQQPRRSPGIVQ